MRRKQVFNPKVLNCKNSENPVSVYVRTVRTCIVHTVKSLKYCLWSTIRPKCLEFINCELLTMYSDRNNGLIPRPSRIENLKPRLHGHSDPDPDPDWLRLHGDKLDSNPDSDHLSHVDCDPDSNPDSGPGARVNAA